MIAWLASATLLPLALATSGPAAAAPGSFELVLALPQRDAAGLEQRFWAIAEPHN